VTECVGFNIPLDTFKVSLETSHSSKSLEWFKPNETATKLRHKKPKQIQRNDTYTNKTISIETQT